jgi:hypothetical protein
VGKIGLEYKYDRLGQTEFFQKLKRLDKPKKYTLVGGLLLLDAVIEQNMAEDTPLRLAIKEILKDAGPEMSKRIINGDEGPLNIDSEKYTPKVDRLEEKTILRSLCRQSVETFTGFCAWLDLSEPDEQRLILRQMEEHGFTEEEIQNMPKLQQEKLRKLFAISREPEKPKKDFLPLTKGVLERRLDSYIARNRKGGGNG